MENLLVFEEVVEEKDEGIAIKNIGLLMFGERPDKLIAGTKIELVRFYDKEVEATDLARRYRNSKIGEFFKEIDLSEKKPTGISKILRGLKRNGSPLPEFETDADRTYMITTIRIHERFLNGSANFAQKNDRSFNKKEL